VNRRILPMVLAVIALGAIGAWYHTHSELQAMQDRSVTGILEPMVALLTEDQALIGELQSEPFIEKDAGILQSYLAKVRRDGVPGHADMKQRLDQLADNNTAIVTLIKANEAHAKTLAFAAEADKFRNYASAWRDRWNSVMELFMVGGNYAASQVPFPKDFAGAVQSEIAASK
jgi:hypothetical protein